MDPVTRRRAVTQWIDAFMELRILSDTLPAWTKYELLAVLRATAQLYETGAVLDADAWRKPEWDAFRAQQTAMLFGPEEPGFETQRQWVQETVRSKLLHAMLGHPRHREDQPPC